MSSIFLNFFYKAFFGQLLAKNRFYIRIWSNEFVIQLLNTYLYYKKAMECPMCYDLYDSE